MKRTYVCLLSNICGGGDSDWERFVELLEEWEIDGSDIVEVANNEFSKINIGVLYSVLFTGHADNIKEIIAEELLDELENSEHVVVDADIVKQYIVDVAENYKATTYDDTYEIWNASDKDDLLLFYKIGLIDFLVETGAVKLDVFGLDREETEGLLRKALYKFLKEEEYTAFDEVVENYLKENKKND